MQYDIILGEDFVDSFVIEAEHADNLWHIRGGPWHPFAEVHNQRVFFPVEPKYRRARVAAEVASLAELRDPESEQIESLVKRVVTKIARANRI